MHSIPILGIVGGIGSGKSTVAAALVRHGGWLIDADQLGHDALKQPDIKHAIVEDWGERVLDASGNIDRKALGRIVFADPAELRALEALVFPYIEKRILEEAAAARASGNVKFVILDAAIMIETGWAKHCDRIVFVDAPRALRLARLQDKRGWSEAELQRREAAQMPLEEKKRHADAVVVNEAGVEEVARQVEELLLQWQII